MKYKLILSAFIFLIIPSTILAQIENPVVFNVSDSGSIIDVKFEFNRLPALEQTDTLEITITSQTDNFRDYLLTNKKLNLLQMKKKSDQKDTLPKTNTNYLIWVLRAGPDNFIDFPDTIFEQKLPFKTAQAITLRIPYTLYGIGEFNFILAEQNYKVPEMKFQISMIFNSSADMVYLGRKPAPYKTPLNAYAYCFGEKISLHIPAEKLSPSAPYTEFFEMDITIEPVPEVGKMSRCTIEASTKSDSINEIQYRFIRAHNLKFDSIPSSPGENPGTNTKFRSTIHLTPKKSGRSYFGIEILGQSDFSRFSGSTTKSVGFNMIFNDAGKLLYFGEIDPFDVNFDPENPIYASMKEIVNYKNTLFGLKTESSQPDFIFERKNQEKIEDSLRAVKRMDSLNQTENNEK